MSLRAIVVVFVLGVATLGFFAWRRNTEKATPNMPQAQSGEQMPDNGMPPGEPPDPGVAWRTPSGWLTRGASGMRLATYVVQAKDGTEAECAVYYFGPGGGGTVDANMQRWISEFSAPVQPERKTDTIHGMRVDEVKLSGKYIAHSMSAAPPEAEQLGWALLGAIVEGPNGLLFFKFTGPQGIVSGAEKDFRAMLSSLNKT